MMTAETKEKLLRLVERKRKEAVAKAVKNLFSQGTQSDEHGLGSLCRGHESGLTKAHQRGYNDVIQNVMLTNRPEWVGVDPGNVETER